MLLKWLMLLLCSGQNKFRECISSSQWPWEVGMRHQAQRGWGWDPDPLVSWPCWTALDFLNKNHLREPGNVGMKSIYKCSGVCGCMHMCQGGKGDTKVGLLHLLFPLPGRRFPPTATDIESCHSASASLTTRPAITLHLTALSCFLCGNGGAGPPRHGDIWVRF